MGYVRAHRPCWLCCGRASHGNCQGAVFIKLLISQHSTTFLPLLMTGPNRARRLPPAARSGAAAAAGKGPARGGGPRQPPPHGARERPLGRRPPPFLRALGGPDPAARHWRGGGAPVGEVGRVLGAPAPAGRWQQRGADPAVRGAESGGGGGARDAAQRAVLLARPVSAGRRRAEECSDNRGAKEGTARPPAGAGPALRRSAPELPERGAGGRAAQSARGRPP